MGAVVGPGTGSWSPGPWALVPHWGHGRENGTTDWKLDAGELCK